MEMCHYVSCSLVNPFPFYAHFLVFNKAGVPTHNIVLCFLAGYVEQCFMEVQDFILIYYFFSSFGCLICMRG
jgi:hypothetical protein